MGRGVVIGLIGLGVSFGTWSVRAWVVSVLWRWVLVPLGLPALPWVGALGLLALLAILLPRTHNPTLEKRAGESDEAYLLRLVRNAVNRGLVTLAGLGFVAAMRWVVS